MAEDKFKLPGSSYEELCKIIKAYAFSDKALSLEDAAALTTINRTGISKNAAFLVAVGILEKGKMKIASSLGVELGRALESEIDEHISENWRKIILNNDFFQKMLTAIKIRNGMDESTLESHILYSAGLPKKKQHLTGARTLIKIFQISDAIIEENGKFIVSNFENNIPSLPPILTETTNHISTELVTQKSIEPIEIPKTKYSKGLQIKVNININCTPDQLKGLSQSLKNLISTLSIQENDDQGE